MKIVVVPHVNVVRCNFDLQLQTGLLFTPPIIEYREPWCNDTDQGN
jgi:hypothetical protein